MTINDAHVHLGKSSGIYRSLSTEDVLKLREKHKIKNLMLMSFENDVGVNNEKIIELSQKYSFIFGLFWIQKSTLAQSVKTLEKLLGNSRIVGVKFHGSYENMPVSSPTYDSIMEILSERESILLVHTGRYKDASLESNTSYLHAIQIAKIYPKIKVVLAHMGGSDTSIIKRAIQDSKDISNIFFDTSGITTPYAIEYAVRIIDARRILFGSDEPWCSFMSMYYNVADAEIPKDDKAMILSDNFHDILVK
jgi:predicted TIM-barrel fold metal-dependent hydrolase